MRKNSCELRHIEWRNQITTVTAEAIGTTDMEKGFFFSYTKYKLRKFKWCTRDRIKHGRFFNRQTNKKTPIAVSGILSSYRDKENKKDFIIQAKSLTFEKVKGCIN